MRWLKRAGLWVLLGALPLASQFAAPAWAAPSNTDTRILAQAPSGAGPGDTQRIADAAAVLYGFESAVNARDSDRGIELFTTDPHVQDGAVYLGTDEVRAWLDSLAADDPWLELGDISEVGPPVTEPRPGGWVLVAATLSRAQYRELGVDPMQGSLAAIVQGAHIGYVSVRPDMLWERRYLAARAQLLFPLIHVHTP
jgi:hypothetical protein